MLIKGIGHRSVAISSYVYRDQYSVVNTFMEVKSQWSANVIHMFIYKREWSANVIHLFMYKSEWSANVIHMFMYKRERSVAIITYLCF